MALVEVVARLRANSDDMVSGFRRAGNAATGFQNQVNGAGSSAMRAFGLISRAALLGAGALQTAGMAGATMGVKFAMANEQAIISFKTLLGSQSAAEDMFKSLQSFAARTPFEFPQLRDAASKLLTTGVAAEKVIPMMTAIGDATSAMGTGAEGIQRAVYALQQMNLVGKVTGQDMMQLANAGIPAWDALATQAGMTVQEVKKAVEKGQLTNSVQLLMQGIENYAGDAMGRTKGMMNEQSKTLVGLMSTLKDNINIALGDMMKPVTNSIKEALPSISDAIGKAMKSMVGPISRMTNELMAQFQKIIPAIAPTLMALSTIMVGFVTALGSVATSVASVLPSIQPAIEQLSVALSSMAAAVAPLIAQLAAGLIPILANIVTVVAGAIVHVLKMKSALGVLVPVLGAFIAAKLAFGATKKAFDFAQNVIDIGKMIARTLGLTAATAAQTAANTALATSETAVATATAAAATAQEGLNIAMYANPIGLVIAAIAALVIGFILLWRKFEGFRVFWVKVWNAIVEGVQDSINKILGVYSRLINKIIKGINLLITAWNAVSWGDDIPHLKEVNFQIDLSAAKVSVLSVKTKEVADNYKTAAEYAKDLYDVNMGFEEAQARADARARKRKKDQQVVNAEKESKALKEAVKVAQTTMKGALKDAQDRVAELRKKADDFASSIKQAIMDTYSFTDALSKSVASQDAYKQAADAVATAQKAVNNAIASRDYQAYVDASADLVTAQKNLADAEKGQMTFMQALKKQYESAKDFSVLINRLRAAGLNEAGISQVVAAGAETGSKIATELLAGGSDAIRDANTWFDELTRTATSTAEAAKQTYYGQGLSAGEALIKGIKDAIEKLQEDLTGKLTSKMVKGLIEDFQRTVADLNKSYGIAVAPFGTGSVSGGIPSTPSLSDLPAMDLPSWLDLGLPAGMGFGPSVLGLASGGVVKATSRGTLARLGEGGSDEAVIPLNGSHSLGGNTYHINVQTGVGDKSAIAEELVSVLKRYEARYGAVPLKTR